MACLSSFPLNETIKQATIQTLKKALDFYVFKDLAVSFKDTNHELSPITSNIDLIAELDVIAQKQHSNDKAFHDDVFDLFLELNDAHTRYYSTCYNRWNWIQPFVLTSFSLPDNPSQQRIFVRDTVFPIGSEANTFWAPFDPLCYKGWEVVEINGVPAIDAVTAFANTQVGVARDPNVRFNLALGRMIYNAGGFKTAYGSFSVRARSPASSSILYTLADTEGNRTTVEVPFIARKPVGTIFADMDSYYQNVCAPASSKAAAAAVITTSTTTSSASTTELPATTTAVEVKQQTSFAPSTNPDKPSSPGNFNSVLQQVQLVPGQDFDTKTRAMVIHNDNDRYSFDINSPLFSSPVDAVYQIDEETAVIKIGSFSANENATLSHWVESLEHLRTNASVKKVIFDVTDNGGGYICLGNALARYLFPDSDAHASDFLASPFYERMADAMINNTDSLFNWEGVKIASTGELASNDSWMHDKISYVKGGLVSNYTQKISLDCSYLYQTLPKMETPPWPAENLAIVSNGYCGSTCTLFTATLQERYNVPTYGIGGRLGSPIAYSEFAGGQVFNLDSLEAEINNADLTNDVDAPQPFLASAIFSFTIREVYSRKLTDVPLEFVYSPAATRIQNDEEIDFSPAALWVKVASMM